MIHIKTTMAFPKLATILISFLLAFRPQCANSAFFRTRHHPTGMSNLDHYYFTIDPPEPKPTTPLPVRKIKKGARCDQLHATERANMCDGLLANNGTVFIRCCKKHCVDVLGDRHNCGKCGRRCGHGMLCYRGTCTASRTLMSS